MIKLSGLTKSYPGRTSPVFEGISGDIPDGVVLGVIGPSGVGKSTLLRVIAGLEAATGKILIQGQDSREARAEGSIGFGFQDASLLPWRTVQGNLELPFKVLDRPVDFDALQRLKELLRLDGLDKKFPDALSGGMAKRVSLARAMVHRPKVLLLDEPLGGVDWPLRRSIMSDLRTSWTEFKPTTIVVSHEVREVAFLCDTIWVMGGAPANIVRRLDVPFGNERKIDLLRHDSFLQFCIEIESMLPIT